MKRSLQIFTFFLVGLFLLISGVNTALDHISRTPSQNSFTFYNEKGEIVLVYNGDLHFCKAYTKPATALPPDYFHRS